jgi:hypothetical protein
MRPLALLLVLLGACGGSVSSNGAQGGPGSCDAGGSSSGGGGSSGTCTDTASHGGCGYKSTANLTTPTVSFKNDVAPILAFSCGISSSCHGGDPMQDISVRGLFLGCSAQSICEGTCLAGGDITAGVYAGLVGRGDAGPDKPLEIAGMPFVTPGDPGQSYIMHKLDDDLCNLQGCVVGNAAVVGAGDTPGSAGANNPANSCGVAMPYQVSVLDVCRRDTIRRWIAQGALDN